jgi:hypothetical protein
LYTCVINCNPINTMTPPMYATIKEFSKRFMKLDPEFWYVTVAFLIACMIWASPVFFLREDVLGKSVTVAVIIAITLYNRIAGIIALILVIALLNRTPGKEGLGFATPTPAPISFKSSTEFRENYCLKGVSDPTTPAQQMEYSYMLSPTMFTTDANGKLQTRPEFIKFLNLSSFNANNGCKLDPTTKGYITITNLCDPTCNWAMNSTTATSGPAPAPTATSMPTTGPEIPSINDMSMTEGFTPMLRPHIRTARHVVSNGMDNLKASANRLKRQFF